MSRAPWPNGFTDITLALSNSGDTYPVIDRIPELGLVILAPRMSLKQYRLFPRDGGLIRLWEAGRPLTIAHSGFPKHWTLSSALIVASPQAKAPTKMGPGKYG